MPADGVNSVYLVMGTDILFEIKELRNPNLRERDMYV